MSTNSMTHAPTAPLRLGTLLCRLAVGALFVLAGMAKLAAPGSFAATLLAYQVLPVSLIRVFGLTLPWVEVLIGLFLLFGLFSRATAWTAIGLLIVFMIAIGQALLRGLSLQDCGCFGGITQAVPQLSFVLGGASLGPGDIVRDAIYALLALAVALGPATPWSVDALLSQD